MLTEEVVESRRDILKHVVQLDVKYQVKILFDIITLVLECKKTNQFVKENQQEINEATT